MKRAQFAQTGVHAFLIVSWLTGWGGCSTAKVDPLPPVPPTPPGYVQVPHPEGLDHGDLMAIFTDANAPSPDELRNCDADFTKLRKATDSRDELVQGARELIRLDPSKYHWCFYSKLYLLEDQLKAAVYIDERQKAVLNTFVFITPFARAFSEEYQDTRYLRWAIARYRKLSELVFYRQMELSAQMTSELASSVNPFGLVRPSRDEGRVGVLVKYGIVKDEEPAPKPSGPPPVATLPAGPATAPSEAPVAPAPAEPPVTIEPSPAPEPVEVAQPEPPPSPEPAPATQQAEAPAPDSARAPATADPAAPATAPPSEAPLPAVEPAATAPPTSLVPPASPDSNAVEALLQGDAVTPVNPTN
jgi:hypothetical protein